MSDDERGMLREKPCTVCGVTVIYDVQYDGESPEVACGKCAREPTAQVVHPPDCDCWDHWRHEMAKAMRRRAQRAEQRRILDRARKAGLRRRNAERLRRAKGE